MKLLTLLKLYFKSMSNRAYYSKPVGEFLLEKTDQILGVLCRNHSFSVEDLQKNAWIEQIKILKKELSQMSEAHILFEYSIPRMGKRIDNVVLSKGIIFAIEFKVGDTVYHNNAIDQVIDYSIDLKNFHEQSHHGRIIPIYVATKAPAQQNNVVFGNDYVAQVLLCNAQNLGATINGASTRYGYGSLDPNQWVNSIYKPTPTIIEAAQALYRGHDIKDISRSDGGAINLSITTNAINSIIENSKAKNEKSICFVTGVPGAGKTLAGLNIANERHKFDDNEHAVFLSGNGPLVNVLQEALARNDVEHNSKIKKKDALTKAKAFIQVIHHFRDDAISVSTPPIEKVVVFDESQRAWTLEQTSIFMKNRKGIEGFNQSEPNFLISIMDRHQDWATIICLVGGGQEINKGEAGLPEWFRALRANYREWNVYVSNEITQEEYTRGSDFDHMVSGLKIEYINELHLNTSIRSFRSENLSNFIKSLLDNDVDRARKIYQSLMSKYPIVITRSLSSAKEWLRKKSRGTERIGIIASSGAARLKPYGLCTQIDIDACKWFLNEKGDIRSSYYLEDIATEFEVQGLELDWTCVAWDANMRYDSEWSYKQFKGTNWQNVNSDDIAMYLKNTYRVLLSRARQGMVIFIPEGDPADSTRLPEFYDGVYNLLCNQIGIKHYQPDLSAEASEVPMVHLASH